MGIRRGREVGESCPVSHTIDTDGPHSYTGSGSPLSSLSLLTPRDLAPEEELGDKFDLNLFNLRPDPIHYVHFIKSFRRSDVASEIFVKLLESYREAKSKPDSDPMQSVHSLS